MTIYPPFQSSPISPFQHIFHSLFSPLPAVGPESVVVKGLEGPISAGRPQQVVCEARGSRPPAILTWWLDGHMKKSISHMVSTGGDLRCPHHHLGIHLLKLLLLSTLFHHLFIYLFAKQLKEKIFFVFFRGERGLFFIAGLIFFILFLFTIV